MSEVDKSQLSLSGIRVENTIKEDIFLIQPQDILVTLNSIQGEVQTIVLDPWYNKGIGGVDDNYHDWIKQVLNDSAEISEHIFLWGFPEIVAQTLTAIPKGFKLVAWLTWYYKNCPSVIRGWRSSQNACLHLSRIGAKLYPENFLNGKQLEKKEKGKLRFIPGPPSVIEEPLLVGFVGKNEQTGHPSQKPVATIKPLVLMSTKPGDVVLDPMCGSGTTGVVCRETNRNCLLSDISEEYTEITEKRLNIKRTLMQGHIDISKLYNAQVV
jgi:hypothetical protein